jgi:hypothetical protein
LATRKSVREYLAAQQARFHHVRAVVHQRSLRDSSCASVGRDGCVAASRRALARRCRCFRRFGRVGEAVAQHWRDEMSHSASILPKCTMRIRLRSAQVRGMEHATNPSAALRSWSATSSFNLLSVSFGSRRIRQSAVTTAWRITLVLSMMYVEASGSVQPASAPLISSISTAAALYKSFVAAEKSCLRPNRWATRLP